MLACFCFGLGEFALISGIVAVFGMLVNKIRGRKKDDCCDHDCSE